MSDNLTNGLGHKIRRYGHSLLLISFVSFVVGFLPGCIETELSDTEYVQRAKDHLDSDDYQTAIIEFKNALRQNPDNAEARLLLAQAYLDTGEGIYAEKELLRAQELGIGREDIILQLAESYQQQGKNDELIDEFVVVGNLSAGEEAQLHVLRGNAYVYNSRFQEGSEEYHAALELEPGLVSALIGEARIAAVQGNVEDALERTNEALASDPEFADGWSLLASIEQEKGNFSEAVAAFNKAEEYRGFPTFEATNRALALIMLGEYSKANADISSLRESGFKDHPRVNYLQGLVFFNQNKLNDALQAFQSSYNAQPSFVPNLYYLATSHYELGNLERAYQLAQTLGEVAPESQAAKKLLGSIQINRAEFDAATALLTEAQERSPGDTVILRLLATAASLNGDTSQAVDYWEKIVSLEPESTSAKTKLMVAKLVDGQSLNEELSDMESGAISQDDGDYTERLLQALSTFQQGNNLAKALEQAQALHKQYPDKADPLKLEASCYLVAAQWDKAKPALEKALERKPQDRTATISLAKVEIKLGNPERAKSLLEELISWYPGLEDANLLLVNLEDSAGDYESSIQILESALSNNPNSLILRGSLARRYLAAGELNRVLELTSNLSKEQTQAVPYLVGLRGKAMEQSGDIVAARSYFRQWSELEPDSAKAHFLYGNSLAKTGQGTAAKNELIKAVELDPGYMAARVGEIKMLVHEGEIDNARTALTSLQKEFGDRPEVLGIAGWFAYGVREYDTAVENLTAAARARPTTDIILLLSSALWEEQKQDEAIEVMQNWLKSHPRDLRVLLQLGDSFVAMDMEADAMATYSKVIEAYPDNIAALNNLAWLKRTKDQDMALDYAEKAYQLAPNSTHVLDTYGMILLDSGEKEKGYRMLQRATARSPDDVRLQLHLGVALVKMEQFDQAREVLTAVVQKVPDAQPAKEAKALLESMP